MRKKELRLVITFHTNAEAMALEKSCKEKGIVGRLIPIPRVISAGCGLAWVSKPELQQTLMEVMEADRLEVEEIHILPLATAL